MKFFRLSFYLVIIAMCLQSCNEKSEGFKWKIDKFDDIKVLQYRVDGFESLTLNQKKLIYYLTKAGLCGRDIIYDQNCRYNLPLRHLLEHMYLNADRNDEMFPLFEEYLKKVWFANGIHHHYSNDKFTPKFSEEYFRTIAASSKGVEIVGEPLFEELVKVVFDPAFISKKVSQDITKDLVLSSAVNFYGDGVSQNDVETFYKHMEDTASCKDRPVSYGLNSRLMKAIDGTLTENVYKIGGLYSDAIEKIVYWLEKAVQFSENDLQKKTIESLIAYYKSGDLKEFDRYSILWLQDTLSSVDFVNGFIENYSDPLGRKASWEAIVNFKDVQATKRTEILSSNAKWFEDNSPIKAEFKKKEVKGVSAKVIVGAFIGGDNYPATAIGINLPNADWIRKEYGSKSVTIGNFTYAYDKESESSGYAEEFYTKEQIERSSKYGSLASDVEVDLHECLGHGSGQLLPGVTGNELSNYSSSLEETRAELFALYYIADPKMVELGVLPELSAAWAEYDKFIFNGMMGQLTRIKPGDNIEEAHMRSRQLIANWAYELGKDDNVIELKKIDDKTYVVINDYQKMRSIFATMLAEIQRVKSEGDYSAGQNLIETYAVKVNEELHSEMLKRYATLGIAPYSGFINPTYIPVLNDEGDIVDIQVVYSGDYVSQQLEYSKNYSFLKFK